jgi:geranylgeranyl pyrophosphate synthase
MDIEMEVLPYVFRLTGVREWPELQAVIRRAASPNAGVWWLPALACEAVGGADDQAVPAIAAVGCLQLSIIVVDDLLDNDPRGEHHRLGAPATANLAAGLQAAGLQAIVESMAGDAAKLAALAGLNRMLLTTALGQHWDTQSPADEDAYWRLVRAKSSPFFGAALQAGALLGGASLELAESLDGLGQLYGELVQIHDDLHDTLAVPANADWLQGRSSLPILFARLVPHPERERFLALRPLAADPEALAELQAILLRCGAVSYCLSELEQRYQRARSSLCQLSLTERSGLEAMLEDQIRPVQSLLGDLGEDGRT